MIPTQLLTTWIADEKSLGAQHVQYAVLSSQGLNGASHGRVVAIREITEENLIFFTQKRTRKVEEIKNNNKVSLTFWFERCAREVIIEGEAHFLSKKQNIEYWASYPKWAQIRFCSYAPTSAMPIVSKQLLEEKRLEIEKFTQNNELPYSPDYCGIAIRPTRFVFYTYRLDELSDVWEYQMEGTNFVKQTLSP
ncbi:MAG TPA: pyridoxamine 5'-phosphate oxidase family protein [Legionella sp.]|nr:pyridoxamine 5'-phosphate oxidase family protein [Legionella sp.]